MFERAARMKLRFDYRGACDVEDLWDLDVEDLDGMFKGLNTELKEQKGESLLETQTEVNEILELKVSIVRHIVEIKLNEAKSRENEILKAERKQKLLSLIVEKQDEHLREKSIDELTELINNL